MTEELQFDIQWLEGTEGATSERLTFAQIQMQAGGETATELEDTFARTVRPWLRASAYELAAWFAENWWRLRWEPESRTPEWRLSHSMAAAGGGVAWPDVTFTSDGVHVLVEAKSTRGGRGMPIRYIRDMETQITAHAFESGIERFIERVLARLSDLGDGQSDLASLWGQLASERRDRGATERRRLEAMLGCDLGEAPEALLAQLEARTATAGDQAVQEVAAAAKDRAAQAIDDLIGSLQASKARIRTGTVDDLRGQVPPSSELPWQRATAVARRARQSWSIPDGPVSSDKLAGLLGVARGFFDETTAEKPQFGAGFRNNHGSDGLSVVMRSRWGTGRRFEAMRLIADHIVAPPTDRLLPVTVAKTHRQKFQRAFAQEFLLPFEELEDRLGRLHPQDQSVDDDEIETVARQYDVSPFVVRTLLVNKGLLPRETLAR
jgi:hypothetical protein